MPNHRYQQIERPFVARVQLSRKVYWLGSYRTRAEAEEVENQFKQALRDIQAEAYAMWRDKYNFLDAVAKVTSKSTEPKPCPHCESTDMDRGATGLDQCNKCGGLSRDGVKL